MFKHHLLILSLLIVLASPVAAADKPKVPQICREASDLLHHNRTEDMPEVIAMYGQCLEHDMSEWNRFISYVNRGNARDMSGDPNGAIGDYSRAIEINPDHYLIYYNRALALRNINDFTGAVADYTRAIELKPDHARSYYNRALDLTSLGQYDRAITDYTKAIEIEPDMASAYGNRAFMYRATGDMERARADAKKARELNPKAKVPTSFAPPDKS